MLGLINHHHDDINFEGFLDSTKIIMPSCRSTFEKWKCQFVSGWFEEQKKPVSSGVAKIALAIADPFWRHIGVVGMHKTATDLNPGPMEG